MPVPFVTSFGTRWRSKVPSRPVCTSGLDEFSFSRTECEVNGFGSETIANHSVIKIKGRLRVAWLTKVVEKVD